MRETPRVAMMATIIDMVSLLVLLFPSAVWLLVDCKPDGRKEGGGLEQVVNETVIRRVGRGDDTRRANCSEIVSQERQGGE